MHAILDAVITIVELILSLEMPVSKSGQVSCSISTSTMLKKQ